MYWLHHHERREQLLACLPAHTIVRRATLSTAAVGRLHGQDRISSLPDDLRSKIVSRLPIKDAVHTTALARGWRRVWHSTSLSLYDAHLLPCHGTVGAVDARTIDCVLTGHPGPFNAVHLENCFAREAEFARWLRLLAAAGVQDLVLVGLHPPEPMAGRRCFRIPASLHAPELIVRRRADRMPLPADILRCANLRRLYVGFWEFPDTSDDLPDGVGEFPQLEELGIIDTYMSGNDLDHMLASSPVLKKLALISDELPQHIHLRGHQTLQCVLFWLSACVKLLVVDAPSMERLIMWPTSLVEVIKIDSSAAGLKVLGYLDLRASVLQIGDTVIKVDTDVSPSSMAPSVKILALKMDFSGLTMVQMLARFLRSFPNIETLHVECNVPAYAPNCNYDEFFENLNSIGCVQRKIKKVVLHKFSGQQAEMAFLRYLTRTANHMQQLTLVMLNMPDGISLGEVKGQLADLIIPPWASEACKLLLLGPAKNLAWTFHRASDLSIQDPFLLDDGQELFCFVKEI